MAKGATSAWPYPVVRFLRGEITAEDLLAAATDDVQRTEARAYLGLDHALAGRTAAARDQFRWVVEHGSRRCSEYDLARAELDRITGRVARAPGP